jgi:NADH-quinone oxidoreductase subunit K
VIAMPWLLLLSAALFTIGVAGVLLRRNAIVVFMSIELMLNAANVALVGFGHELSSLDGQVFVFFVLAVAAAEAAVGLALLIALFRHRATVNLDEFHLLRW